MRRNEAEPLSLDLALARYLNQMGLAQRSREALAAVLWAETVGPWYAQHTTVAKVEDGVMTIHCDSAPHAQQLQADAEKILARLNLRVAEYLGPGKRARADREVKEIRATSAYMGRGGPGAYAPAARSRQAAFNPAEVDGIALTPAEEAQVEALAGELDDERLRRRFATAMRSSLRLRRWQLGHGWRVCEACGGLLEAGETECWVCRPPEPPDQVRV
jgi:predicted nucleic acid-binding Zn ribbon protein